MILNKKIKLAIGLILLTGLIAGIFFYFFIYSKGSGSINRVIKNMTMVEKLHFTETVFETKTNGKISYTSGDIIFPNKLRVNLIPELKDGETLIIGSKIYKQWSSEWFIMSKGKPEDFNLYNPQKFISLLGFVSNEKSLGAERVDNQDMDHFGFTINKNEAEKTFSQKDNTSYEGEVWIGKSDGLIHRIAITFIPNKKDEVPRKYQMDFSNFDGNITIEEPKTK